MTLNDAVPLEQLDSSKHRWNSAGEIVLRKSSIRTPPRRRYEFLPSQIVAMARALLVTERAEAAKRLAHGRTARGRKMYVSIAKGHACDIVAKQLRLSRATLYKMIAVVSAGEQNPQVYSDIVAEMDERQFIDASYRELCERRDGQSTGRVRHRSFDVRIGRVRVGDFTLQQLRRAKRIIDCVLKDEAKDAGSGRRVRSFLDPKVLKEFVR